MYIVDIVGGTALGYRLSLPCLSWMHYPLHVDHIYDTLYTGHSRYNILVSVGIGSIYYPI